MPRGGVGTMDTLGWVTEPTLKINRKIAYWFATRRNQCITIKEVESYTYVKETVQGTKGSRDVILEAIERSLTKIISECFDRVSVATRAEDVSTNGTAFRLLISGSAFEDGKEYDFSYSVLLHNKTFELIEEGRHAED